MTNIKIFIVIISIFAVSCTPNVLFKEPLPPNIQSITELPIGMKGSYACQSDDSFIEFTKDAIIKENYYSVILPLSEINQSETCAIVDGGLHIDGRQECIPFTYISEDTISAEVFDLDTLFSTQRDVFKLYKGHLFVNTLGTNSAWMTFMVTPNEYGDLLWELILVPDDINKIKDVTSEIYSLRTESGTIEKYIINPSLKEFDDLLNGSYTIECEYLTPVKPVRPY